MRARVLLVEEDALVALKARLVVEGCGHEVVAVCNSGEAALTTVTTHQVDLALVAIHLRGRMDGVTLAEELHVCDGIAVVFVSAFDDIATLTRATVVGAYGFVTKPYTAAALAAALTVALSKHVEVRRTARRAELKRVALDHTRAAILVTGGDGVIQFANRAAAQLLGISSIALVGHDIASRLVDVDGWPAAPGAPWTTKVRRLARPDAAPVWATVVLTILPSGEARAVWTLEEHARHA